MPRRKRSLSPCDFFDDDFDDDSNSSSRNGHPPIQRNAANARERARMRVLSSAFGRLKTKLPNIPPDTKLSKLDTLRLATMYIKQLRALAEGSSSPNDNTINPIQFTDHHTNIFGMQNGAHNMTWPFGLHHIQNPANRQLPFQCSTMEWSSSHEIANLSKNTRLDDDSHYQTHHHQSQQVHPWYTNTNHESNCITHRDDHNNYDVFSGFNQTHIPHSQNQHLAVSLSSSASINHHQNAMSPIR